MTNQQAVVDQIVQNLAFEVEAVPKNKSIHDTSISQSTPLNVKIKVRKKDEILKQHDVSSIADGTRRAVQKIRLVNSDRTIMTFDVFMEAEFEKKPSRKNLRKHIFDMLRPGICLGAVDDDKYPYMPSSSYSANITEPSVAIESDGTLLKQTFTLSKNVYQTYTASTQPGGQKWLFGKCKPGGCLDPPFSEDKYSYKPSIRAGPEREGEELIEEEDVGPDIHSKQIPITLHDEEVQNNGRHSSIFDSGLFKKKRKSSDKSTNTKLPDKTDSIVDIYQGKSATNSASTHSNSIITYPPKVRSDPRISDDKTVRSRGPSEDKSRKSFNDHSEPYFIRPKGVNPIKEKKALDPSDYPKHLSSDATDLRNSIKESFKMPIPLPIPIPIMSNKRKSEVIATNDNILKTQSDSANVTETDAILDQKPLDQESQDAINLKDTDMRPRLLRDTSATGDTDDKLDKPITPNELDDQNLHEIKLQPLKDIDSENNIEVTAQLSKKNKTEPLKVPVPVPVPFIFSEANHAATLDPKMINDNLQRSEMKLTESKQSFETKTTPPTITTKYTNKDTPFADSKEMLQNIDPGNNRSRKSASTATSTPKSQFSDIEAHAIPENYLRTRGGFSDQESDTENSVSMAPTIEEVTKRDYKGEKITEEPATQNEINNKGSTATKVATIATATAAAAAAAATAAAAAAAVIEESSEICDMPDTDTQQIKGSQQISLSKLPILKRSMSILSGIKTSAASVNDKTKRSDRPDKRLDNVGHRDTDKSISTLSQGKTSPTSVTDSTKRSDSPDKDLDNVGDRDTDKGISTLSQGKTSAASVTDETKRSDSPDKYLDNVGYRDTDFGVHIDEKRTSLSSGLTSAASVKDKTKKSDSPGQNWDNVGHRETDLGIHKDEKRSSLSSGPISAESVKNKTKRHDSPEKHLDNVGHRDTGFGLHKDENRTSLASWPKDEIDTLDAKISEPPSDKEYLSETEKPNNDDNINYYTESQARFIGEENLNFKIAPIIIDNTDATPNFKPLQEVNSETNFFAEPMNTGHDFKPSGVPFTTQIASRLRKFDEDNGTHSTVSRELIGTKSVIYYTDEYIPTTSEQKNAERISSYDKRDNLPVDIVIPSIQSTSTLKSAMKKDTMSVELGFHSYLNDKNERMLRTFDTANAPKRLQNDSVTVLKSQIRISSNEIRIPVDSEHDMSIQIKKSNANQRVSISESGFVNTIDNSRVKKQRSPEQYSDAEMTSSEAKAEVRKDNILKSDARDDHFIDYYEQELVPLQLIIKNLRDEIDVLAAQQLIFKDKIFCANKSTIPRLVHSNKKCFGCVRK